MKINVWASVEKKLSICETILHFLANQQFNVIFVTVSFLTGNDSRKRKMVPFNSSSFYHERFILKNCSVSKTFADIA